MEEPLRQKGVQSRYAIQISVAILIIMEEPLRPGCLVSSGWLRSSIVAILIIMEEPLRPEWKTSVYLVSMCVAILIIMEEPLRLVTRCRLFLIWFVAILIIMEEPLRLDNALSEAQKDIISRNPYYNGRASKTVSYNVARPYKCRSQSLL